MDGIVVGQRVKASNFTLRWREKTLNQPMTKVLNHSQFLKLPENRNADHFFRKASNMAPENDNNWSHSLSSFDKETLFYNVRSCQVEFSLPCNTAQLRLWSRTSIDVISKDKLGLFIFSKNVNVTPVNLISDSIHRRI